ncbi:hypothetical protein ACFE04_029696 [Oxalis oulophora]
MITFPFYTFTCMFGPTGFIVSRLCFIVSWGKRVHCFIVSRLCLVQQLQTVTTSELHTKIVELYEYEKSRGTGKFAESVYYENARAILQGEYMYMFSFGLPSKEDEEIVKSVVEGKIASYSLEKDLVALTQLEIQQENNFAARRLFENAVQASPKNRFAWHVWGVSKLLWMELTNNHQQNQSPLVAVKTEEVEDEFFDFNPNPVGDHNVGGSSSRSNVRSSLIGMGFSLPLIDKVIQEKGEDNFDVLVDALLSYAAVDNQTPASPSSGFFDDLFDNEDVTSRPGPQAPFIEPKEEPDLFDEVHVNKRASLLMMNFSRSEIEFAFSKLGEAAQIEELVDFIFAAQKAEESEDEEDVKFMPSEEQKENLDDTTEEALFGTMEKTLHLLEMGFSESEISIAIDNFGYTVPVSELANSIFTGFVPKPPRVVDTDRAQISDPSDIKIEDRMGNGQRLDSNIPPVRTKTKKSKNVASTSGSRNISREDIRKGKKPRQEFVNNMSGGFTDFDPHVHSESLKPEAAGDTMSFLDSTTWLEEDDDDEEDKHLDPRLPQSQVPKFIRSNPSAGKPPYFFYGSVVNMSSESWMKISNFLRGGEPEFMNARFFSALRRKEGYVHNLPTENRFEVRPKAPMTLQEAMPHTKKWWPSWDSRKQLRYINSAVVGISQICDRIGQTLLDSRGKPSFEQQRYILHQCQLLNLVWVGKFKVVPMELEDFEHILGYPRDYTQDAASSLTDKLNSIKQCFQTDTLGYILSGLKSIFPEGITVLSLMSGMGGVEVTLDRLGIRLKGVVCVESSEMNRRIFREWWKKSGQTGHLIQIEALTKLNTRKFDELMEKFGGFDLVVYQNPSSSQDPSGLEEMNFDFSLFYEFVRLLQRLRLESTS